MATIPIMKDKTKARKEYQEGSKNRFINIQENSAFYELYDCTYRTPRTTLNYLEKSENRLFYIFE